MICFYVSKFDLYELEEKKGSKRQIFLDAMRLFFNVSDHLSCKQQQL